MQATWNLGGLIRTFAVVAAFMLVVRAPAQETKPAEKPGEKPAAKPEAAKTTTLENLQKAYDGESNARARYVECAKKAEEEGYGQVASLFRAVARSEEIHAGNHADVIKKMGGTAKADLKKPDVKSTKENLALALIGESFERDTMYPDFVKQAKAENNKDAAETFNYSLQCETGHAKLFQEALENIDQWKTGKKDFFVCGVCGNTVTKVDFEKCPVCFTPKSKYEKVN